MFPLNVLSLCLLLLVFGSSPAFGFSSPIHHRSTSCVIASSFFYRRNRFSDALLKKQPKTELGHRVLSPMDHAHDHDHHHHQQPSLFFMPKASRAKIRVAIAAIATFLVASLSQRNVLSPKWQLALNIFVTISITVFLGLVEKGRKWIAELRAQASVLWASLEAHSGNPSDSSMTTMSDENTVRSSTNARAAERITIIGTVVNIGLTVFKFIAGIFGKSSAMIADAGHSLSDLLSDVVTLWTVRIANLPADDDHPYGHGRFEALGALAIAGMLIMAAVGFGSYAYESFCEMILAVSASASVSGNTLSSGHATTTTTGKIALVAAAVSILSKELLYQATARVAQKTESQGMCSGLSLSRSLCP
jgi:hypothetical protein